VRSWAFFLPRKFLMTNKMLDLLRAAGHYEGKRGRPKRSFAYDKYAAEAASIRVDVARVVSLDARAAAWGASLHLGFSFLFIGHERFDRDAGLLPAKEMIDGICAALGYASDRKVVAWVRTSNCISVDESWRGFVAYQQTIAPRGELNKFGPGVLVELEECKAVSP
jgi:hypothetical protein